MEKIIIEVIQLIKLIRSYGTEKYMEKNPEHNEVENVEEFFGYSNEGMKKAQGIILAKLTLLSEEEAKLNQKLKTVRSAKPVDKGEIENIKNQLKENGFYERIFRKLADTIVWQIFGGRRELIARQYLEEEGSKSFKDNGFMATLAAAIEINKNPFKFALISDLTNCIQVGDLLVWTFEGIEIYEIKTGKMNKTALDLFHFYDINQLDAAQRIEQLPENHFKNQMKRMLKQKETNIKTVKILQNDSGEYQKNPGTTVSLKESKYAQQTYHDELYKLIKETEGKKWASTSIEGIINIGVYREECRGEVGKISLKQMNHDFPVYDLRDTLDIKICESIFSKPFPEEMIADILFGKIQVLIGIDYDALIERAKDLGLPLRWSTPRELNEIRQGLPIKSGEILSVGKRGLVIDDGKTKAFIGSGFMIRLVFDHLSPTVELSNRLTVLDDEN